MRPHPRRHLHNHHILFGLHARVCLAIGFTIADLVVILAISPPAIAGINAWTTGGPEGGRVTAIAADQRIEDVVYASTDNDVQGAIFKSSTGAAFWTRVLPNGVDIIAIAPSSPNTIDQRPIWLQLHEHR